MALDESWNVKGLAPEIRDVAREAARRRGVTVDEWLQAAISDSAAEDGVGRGTQGQDRGERSRRPNDRGGHSDEQTAAVQAIHARLDDLYHQLNRLSGTNAALPLSAASPGDGDEFSAALRGIENRLAALDNPTAAAAPPAQQLVDALAHLDQRLDQLMSEGPSSSSELDRRIAAVDRALAALNGDQPGPSPDSKADFKPDSKADSMRAGPNSAEDWTLGLDRAVAEITQRQRALEVDAPRSLQRQFAALSHRLGDNALRPLNATAQQSELKDHLRQLTEELQTWRRSGGFHDALAVLREELAEIGRKFTEAVPRKALQALEAEVRTLVERVDRNRLQGADSSALTGIEQGLAEVREVLRQFAPAESLTAFRDEVRALDRKIEWVAANSDGGGLKQLEASVAELREIASHAASGEALIALAEEVQAIADKIDNFGNPAFKTAETGAHGDGSAPAATANLVAIVETLAAKLDHLELSRDAAPALDAIASQLARLTERIESTDARLDSLDHIERTFSELLSRLDDLQTDAVAAAERAARDAVMQLSHQSPGIEADVLKQDIDALRQTQAHSDRHIQDTLEVVHDTLERLVDRLAIVETNIRREGRDQAATPAGSIDPVYAPTLVPSHAAIEASSGTAVSDAMHAVPPTVGPATRPSAEWRPIDPTLPADHPLEPGAGRMPRPLAASAAERIAASEAALGPAKPAPEPDAKSNFIAAARRAAQAAANMSPPPDADAKASKGETEAPSFVQRITRRRSVMAALAVLIVAGGVPVAFNVMGLNFPRWRTVGGEQARPVAAAVAPARDTGKSSTAPVKTAAATKPTVTPTIGHDGGAASTSAGPESSSVGPSEASREASASSAPSAVVPSPRQDAKSTSSVSPLTIASIQLPVGDVTGSLGRTTGLGRKPGDTAAPLPTLAPPAATPRTGVIPAGLQAAATGGDVAAEYEIAARYAEGRGVPLNLEEAARWFERAANRDLAPAQYRLGSLYEKGQGVKKDLEQARRFYRAAAEKGNGKAMHNLAVLHAEGVDGKPDFNAAAQWFRKAAQRGVADSQYNLGILYARGLAVEANLVESYKWFALAAQQGDQEAGKKRDEIAARLDQQAAVAARQAVQTFAVEPQPEEATTVKAPPGGLENLAPAAAIGKPKTGSSGPRKFGS